MFETYLEIQKDKLDTEKLNLDGPHNLVKKSVQSAAYQYRKKAKTSNVLIMTDGKGIPIAIGAILAGNHNDLYRIVPQFTAIIKENRIIERFRSKNSILNTNKGSDKKKLKRALCVETSSEISE